LLAKALFDIIQLAKTPFDIIQESFAFGRVRVAARPTK